MKAITEWIEKGLLKRKFHIVNGLDGAPSALPLLYSGGNTGKLCVFLAPVQFVPYPASLGSSGFLNTKTHPGYKSCGCLRAVLCLLISTSGKPGRTYKPRLSLQGDVEFMRPCKDRTSS